MSVPATGDTGRPDPRLVDALAAGDPTDVATVLLGARVVVPIVATGEQTGTSDSSHADLAVPGLVGVDGRIALPVFTGTASLEAWRAGARPVPMTGAQAMVAALDEGYAALVLDVAGPVSHVIDSDRLAVLGDAARALLDGATGTVRMVPE